MVYAQRIVLAALLPLFYLGIGVFDHGLWAPTEQAVAGVTWEMYRTGNLFIPAINGLPYLEKPPLAYLLSWASFEIAGHMSPGLLRLPAVLLGLASVWLVFWTARRFYGSTVAWVCAFLCALTANFYGIMHRASTDAVAIFFVFLCFALFMRTISSRSADVSPAHAGSRSMLVWDLAFCTALAVSFFAKNFYTYLIVVPPVVVFLLATGQTSRLLVLAGINALILTILLVPWCYDLYAHGGLDYLRVVFFDNTVGRLLDTGPPAGIHLGLLDDAFVVHKNTSHLMVFAALASEMVPWLLIYPAALWALWREPAKQPARLFIKIAFVSILVCLTASASRVETYYRPVIFLLVLMAGAYFEPLFGGVDGSGAGGAVRRRRARVVATNFWAVGFVLTLAPIAIGLYFHAHSVMWLTLPGALFFSCVVLGTKDRWADAGTVRLWEIFVAASMAVALIAMIPRLDSQKSSQPFFAAVRSHLDGAQLWTALIDDKRLPAMDYYLDRRLELVRRPREIPQLLRQPQRVGVIVSPGEYAALRPCLRGIPHWSMRSDVGRRRFVYLSNVPPRLPVLSGSAAAAGSRSAQGATIGRSGKSIEHLEASGLRACPAAPGRRRARFSRVF